MPIDREPVEGGNVEIVDDGKALVHANDAPSLLGGDRFVSHFSTCPEAEAWRSK